MKRSLTYIILFLFIACSKEEALPVTADFEIEVVNNDFSIPVEIIIFNRSKGAEVYEWFFEGGKPETSNKKNPGSVLYEVKGEYTIRLFTTNEDLSEDSKEIVVKIDDPVLVDFDFEIIESNYPPVEVAISNATSGANTYNWTFEGGNPSTSNALNPENVIFSEPGNHIIKLEVSNGLETYALEKTVAVAEDLNIDFNWEPSFDDDDLQAPVKLSMVTNTISVTSYNWLFEGGTPESSTDENPLVVFNEPGIYKISLTGTNGKETQLIEKEIQIFENTNLRALNNIKFGINTAHNTNLLGSFFSTKTRQVYTKEQINETDGSHIDIVFFGLNQNFSFNKFMSPDNLNETSFDIIEGGKKTKFINSQELCNCVSTMSVDEFDAMNDDNLLQSLTINETSEGNLQFDNSILPRIVLFESSAGIKGAIKIKEFVSDGSASYMLTDIKFQKNSN